MRVVRIMSIKKNNNKTLTKSSCLYHGDNNEIFKQWLTTNNDTHNTIPLSFNDLLTITNIRKAYNQGKIGTSLQGKIRKKLNNINTVTILLSLSYILLIIKTVLLTIFLSYISKSQPLLFFLSIIVPLIIFYIEVSYLFTFAYDCVKNIPENIKYCINKKTKKTLQETTFLQVPNTIDHHIDSDYKKTIRKINDIILHNTNNLNVTNFDTIKNSYDNYVNLLAYIIINKHTIPQTVLKEYSQQLLNQSQELRKQLNNTEFLIVQKQYGNNKIILPGIGY